MAQPLGAPPDAGNSAKSCFPRTIGVYGGEAVPGRLPALERTIGVRRLGLDRRADIRERGGIANRNSAAFECEVTRGAGRADGDRASALGAAERSPGRAVRGFQPCATGGTGEGDGHGVTRKKAGASGPSGRVIRLSDTALEYRLQAVRAPTPPERGTPTKALPPGAHASPAMNRRIPRRALPATPA